eukprot:gb/GECG01007105.1/.p1 GENE.gb/GECG01007105.1/~~gb/GECG01007105.1/.p1  ORF type:complete len:1288 (+),score=179.06 gb/GECG01007105.1/:1-3864(+)
MSQNNTSTTQNTAAENDEGGDRRGGNTDFNTASRGTGLYQQGPSHTQVEQDSLPTFPSLPMMRRGSDTFPPLNLSPSRTVPAVTASNHLYNGAEAAHDDDGGGPPFTLGEETFPFDDSISDTVLHAPGRDLLKETNVNQLSDTSNLAQPVTSRQASGKPREDNLSVASDQQTGQSSTMGGDSFAPYSTKKTADSFDSKTVVGTADKFRDAAPADDVQSVEDPDDPYHEISHWWKRIFHSSSFQLQAALLVTGAIVWGVGAAISNHRTADKDSFLVGGYPDADIFVWEILLFSGATLVLYVGCSFINWLVFTGVSYLVTSRFWAVALYLAAFDGPLRNVLFSGFMWLVWSAYLPPFGNVQDRVLTLLVVMAGVDAAKELLLKIFKGKVTKDQFKERLMSIVDRMITLQNLSALAVTVNRERKKRKQRKGKTPGASSAEDTAGTGGNKDANVAEANVGEEQKERIGSPRRDSVKGAFTAVGRERQHSTIGPLTPISKMMRSGKVSQLSLDTNEGDVLQTEADSTKHATVVDVHPDPGIGAIAPDIKDTKNPPSSSSSPPVTVNAQDLRDIDNAEQRYHILAREVRKGKFKLFDGKGEIITINNGSIARKAAASIFNQLDLRRTSTISVQDLMELPGARMTEDEAEEIIAKLGFRVDKQVSRRGFIMFANKVHSDFRGLGSTLKSYSVVTRAVRMVLNIVYVAFCFIFALLLFRVSPTAVLIPAATLLVSLSFALGTTANNFIQSLVYILAWSPYNVGDRVRVNDSIPMWVHEIDVYYTAFKRLDNSIEMHANHVLSGCRIRNETRAEYAIIEFPIRVGYRTSALQLDKLTTAVIHWIRERKHVWKEDFVEFYIYDISANEHLDIAFWIGHRFTFHNGAALWGDMSKLRMFILETMRRLGIEYVKATQPVYIGSREEIVGSMPALAHDSSHGYRQPTQPNIYPEGASSTASDGPPYGENDQGHYNFSESINAFRDTYTNPNKQREDDSRRSRRGRSESPTSELSRNRFSAPDLASLSREQVLKLGVDGSIPESTRTYNSVTRYASEDTRRKFEKALAAPPLTSERLGLLRIDDEREAKIAQFDAETHARNFVDIRAGGVHHTWNWSLPLHQRSTVLTAPEHIEHILRKNDPDSYDAKLLKGLGYGLSLQAAKAKQQQQTRQRRGKGKRNPMQRTNSTDFSMMMMPGSFGGIKLAKQEPSDLDSSERVPFGAVQTLLKDTFRDKDKPTDFKKMTPGQKLLYTLSRGGIQPTNQSAGEQKRRAPAPPGGGSSRALLTIPAQISKKSGRSTPP